MNLKDIEKRLRFGELNYYDEWRLNKRKRLLLYELSSASTSQTHWERLCKLHGYEYKPAPIFDYDLNDKQLKEVEELLNLIKDIKEEQWKQDGLKRKKLLKGNEVLQQVKSALKQANSIKTSRPFESWIGRINCVEVERVELVDLIDEKYTTLKGWESLNTGGMIEYLNNLQSIIKLDKVAELQYKYNLRNAKY
jgi:hypothetical protein